MFLLRSPAFGIVGSMDRDKFLRAEYERIRASGAFMAVEWRDSVERFVTDLWDMTPAGGKKGRFLAMRDTSLGFSRDNVEWHFPQLRKARKQAVARIELPPRPKPMKPRKPKPLSAAQTREAEKQRLQAEKQAKREALAAEFMRWERRRAG